MSTRGIAVASSLVLCGGLALGCAGGEQVAREATPDAEASGGSSGHSGARGLLDAQAGGGGADANEAACDGACTPGALELDGIDDLVVVTGSSSLDLTGAMTIQAWLKTTSTAPDSALVGKHECGVSAGWFLGLRSSAGKPANVGQWFVDHDPRVEGSSSLGDGSWHHLAGTWDGTALTLYVDGTAALTQAWSYVNGTDVEITLGVHGSSPACVGGYYAGRLDEVSIWSVARTAAEIAADAAAPLTGREPGLIAYFRFDEPSGQAIPDLSESGWDAVLGSSPSPASDDPLRVLDGPFD